MNTRFAVATHILTLLQTQPGEPMSSEWIAGSVGTNAALIRRLLGQLSRAGLTRSQMGPSGGALLARPASAITLADVYDAIVDQSDLLPVHATPNPKCPVGRHIQGVLESRVAAAQSVLRAELAKTTIADLTADVVLRVAR